MKRARLINNRPTCFVALFLVVGILVAEAMYGVGKLYYLIPTVLFALVAVGLFSFKKTRKFCYMAVALLVGFLAMTGANDVYDSKLTSVDDYFVVQGKIDSEIAVDDRTEFFIKDIYLGETEVEGRAKVFISSTSAPDYGVGDTIVLIGHVSSLDHERFDTLYATSFSNEYYYRIYGGEISKVADGSPSFPRNIQISIKQTFHENLDYNTASICQALVLGDKFGMDEDLQESVQVSGLAHVLAVSGLHVTTLATALYMVLKKLKVKPKVSLVVVTILTLLYSMLCSFTPSSLRACIMTFVLNFASAYGYKQDNLSSLSLAAIILLLINPTNILNVGFLLSFTSVLGIFLAYRPLSNLGRKAVEKLSPKHGFGNRLSETLSVSLSANLVSLPFAAYFFGTIPVLFLVSNLVILPYLMFIYLILLLITVFVQVTTLSGLVFVMQPLLFPFVKWVEFVGSISWAQLDASLSVVLIVFYIVGCLCCSRYVFLKKSTKVTIAVLLTASFLTVQTLSLVLG